MANGLTIKFQTKNYYVPPNFKKGTKMKHINKLIKDFFEDKIEWAEENSDSDYLDFRKRESKNLADILYIADFCDRYPADVLDWLCCQGFEYDERTERLCDLMIKKISNDVDRCMGRLVGSLING